MTNKHKGILRDRLLRAARWIVSTLRKANPRAKLPRYLTVSRLWNGTTWIDPANGPRVELVQGKTGKQPKQSEGAPDSPLMSIVYDRQADRIADEWITPDWSELTSVPGVLDAWRDQVLDLLRNKVPGRPDLPAGRWVNEPAPEPGFPDARRSYWRPEPKYGWD